MRIIGILGGMGPQATVDLYQKIVNLTPATRDQEHLPVLIWSDPHIPDRTAAILYGGEDPRPALCAGTARLVRGGAECIGMPCNTAHYYLEAIRQAAEGIPVLDMIELAAKSASDLIGAEAVVAVTATRGTLATGLYDRALLRYGLRPLVPSAAEQEIIDSLIFGPRGVKAGFVDEVNCLGYEDVCRRLLRSGAEAIVAACTELPLISAAAARLLPIIDPTSVLAAALVDFGLKDAVHSGDGQAIT
jgi:aspartate racemase